MIYGNIAEKKRQIMTPELEESIIKAQTRQCNNVLRGLYTHRLNNKQLAQYIGISASALSNILQKIKANQLGLLVIEQDGRNTYYSLSELGNEYVEKYLLDSTMPEGGNGVINIDDARVSEDAQNAILKIKEIQQLEGDGWQLKLDDFLLSYTSGALQGKDNCYVQLVQSIEHVIIKECWEDLNKIYTLLDSDLLCKRVEKVFSNLMGIKSLCILDEKNWEMAYRLVDDYFEHAGKYIRTEFLEQIQIYQMSVKDVKTFFNVLGQLVEDAEEKRMLKEEFYGKWKVFFTPHERLLYYIAEKYIRKNDLSE